MVMKGGQHLVPLPMNRPPYRAQVAPRARVRRGMGMTAFYGHIVSNSPQQGTMTVQLQDTRVRGRSFLADIPYVSIGHIQRILVDVEGRVETAPASHPGAAAFGTKVGPGDHSRGFVLAPVRM
jgi:hypothetical protein